MSLQLKSAYIFPEIKVPNLSHISIIQIVKQLQLWVEPTPCRAQQDKWATQTGDGSLSVRNIAEYLCYDVGEAVQVKVANDWLREVEGHRIKEDTG